MKDQVRGKAEEIKGKLTGDRPEELKGKARQQVGNVKRTVRDVKEDIRTEVNRKRASR
ncbi:MAG TPA: CsbD family protein [Candidatus Dormibacteraeota bacterium]